MEDKVQKFNEYREKMNKKILEADNKTLKRLFNLDTNVYASGVLPVNVKEMLGLVASLVLRCDDCVKYHLGKCYEQKVSTEALFEVLAIANIVGGTIVIPHTRKAVEYWEALSAQEKNK